MMKYSWIIPSSTAQKRKVSFKGLFSKCDQIHRKLRIWSHLLKKYLMENLIFCVVVFDYFYQNLLIDVWKSPEYASRNFEKESISEAVSRKCAVKMVFLKISHNSQENACVRVSFLIIFRPQTCNVIKKETLPCEFDEMFKNTFFIEHPRWLFLVFWHYAKQNARYVAELKEFMS